MFNDIIFAADSFINSYPYRAARLAVLYKFKPKVHGLHASELALRVWQRGLVEFLFKYGKLPGLKTFDQACFARNCPPVGVRPFSGLRVCGSSLLCPYCRARQVADCYRRLSKVIFPKTYTSSAKFSSLSRVRLKTKRYYDDEESWRRVVAETNEVLRVSRRYTVRASGAAAGFSYARVFIRSNSLVTLNTFVLVGNDDSTNKVEATFRRTVTDRFTSVDVSANSGTSRRELVRSTAAAFRFPFDMFDSFRQGVLPLRKLSDLVALVDRRLLRTYGASYGNNEIR